VSLPCKKPRPPPQKTRIFPNFVPFRNILAMKKSILIIILVIITNVVGAQSIVEICQSFINQNSTDLISFLDSSNVVRNFYIEKDKSKVHGVRLIIGLRDENDISYVLKLSGRNVEAGRKGSYDDYFIITVIVVNFPHSSSEHMNSLKQIKGFGRHVGIYSTDLTIK